jgi:phosphoserine phosphatase
MTKSRLTLGIDLRYPHRRRFSTYCLLDGEGRARYATAKNATELATAIAELHPVVTAIGSPISEIPQPGAVVHGAEAALRRLEHHCCINPRFATPPLSTLPALAKRGTDLARLLKSISRLQTIIETHPSATLEFLSLSRPRAGLSEKPLLERAGIVVAHGSHSEKRREAELNALLAAITAELYRRSETVVIGEDESGGAIYLPRPRRLRLVVFDVDGTLTDVRSPWRHVHERMGLWEGRGERILQRFLSGEISYDKFCDLDVGLWRDIGASIDKVYAILDAIDIRPQVPELLRRLNAAGIAMAMISTGFRPLAERVVRAAGLEGEVEIIANDLKLYRGTIKAKVDVSNDRGSRRSKGSHLRRLLSRRGISPVETLAVGDGPSDRELFERCAQSLLVEKPTDLHKTTEIALRSA